MSEQLWVELTHEDYAERARRDTFADDHYTGEARDKAEKAAYALTDREIMDPETKEITGYKLSKKTMYLYRRAQGETKDAYVERVVLSRFPNHHADVVDSFSGQISALEGKADRDLSVFGDKEKEGDFAHIIWNNADGKERDYLSMYSDAGDRFTNFCRVWYLVESDSFHWIDGRKVKNWFYNEQGVLSDVIVEEMVDGRGGIKSDYPSDEERIRYIHYHLEGYDRYRIVKEKDGKRRLDLLGDESGKWDFPHYDEKRNVVLPIGFIDLSVKRHPGYKMAQDANYLYNLLSDIRNTLRIANHHKLTGDVGDDEFDNSALSLQQGSNLLQGAWQYISPSIENAIGAYEIYQKEVRDFYITNHKRYNDVAKETATEARQEDQKGNQSWLNKLTTALDNLEKRVLYLLVQKRFPKDRSKWGEVSSIERSREFQPMSSDQFADKLMSRYIEGVVPIGPTGVTNVIKTIAALDGVVVEEDEIDESVSDVEVSRRQEETFDRERREIEDLINRAA